MLVYECGILFLMYEKQSCGWPYVESLFLFSCDMLKQDIQVMIGDLQKSLDSREAVSIT